MCKETPKRKIEKKKKGDEREKGGMRSQGEINITEANDNWEP